jgi:hypothetical protein
MKINELDLVFISYDEPNADKNYSDLVQKAPWAKRVHGIKGSDNAHKEAAKLSESDFFVTVDADNIVDDRFLDFDLNMSDPSIKVYGWCGLNKLNGLRYGNGGLKIWNRQFVLDMRTHEAAESENAQVDFCWEQGYRNFAKTFSTVDVCSTPMQAWRAGFREGVKMTLLNGVKIPSSEIQERVWWHNLHRLKIWSTVGAHEKNGLFAVYGARLGTWMSNCTDWNYIDVRDFDRLKEIYKDKVEKFESNQDLLIKEIIDIGKKIHLELGFDYPYLDEKASKYVLDLYNETISLSLTYHIRDLNV